MVSLTLSVNGRIVDAEIDPRMLLVEFLRERLRLTGTHVGCDTAQCGACTVHLNGRAVKSCNVLAVQAARAEVTTIEGIAAADGELHPMQAAFREHHGLQCGFCTPGFVMNAIDIARRHVSPTEQTIRAELDGNLCRCTGYHNIVKAVQAGAAVMRESGDRP
ncbi:MAG TPA: (2Fe-2S)-binding protein [Burkholderiales bacterium]|nr:(2Fe-2S)-binding protein [Burkholderiales bacterium]